MEKDSPDPPSAPPGGGRTRNKYKASVNTAWKASRTWPTDKLPRKLPGVMLIIGEPETLPPDMPVGCDGAARALAYDRALSTGNPIDGQHSPNNID